MVVFDGMFCHQNTHYKLRAKKEGKASISSILVLLFFSGLAIDVKV